MQTGHCVSTQDHAFAVGQPDLNEIVMGLHWDPVRDASAEPADLDALCVLFDEQRRVLDIIHPGRPRNANGSVIHTGDSRTGASAWDDERIFVFLNALPNTVATASFVVVSATGRAFSEVRGASCHVSDHATEHEWIRVDLTTLETRTAYCVATMRREPRGWSMTADSHVMHDGLLAELMARVAREKTAGVAPRHPQ